MGAIKQAMIEWMEETHQSYEDIQNLPDINKEFQKWLEQNPKYHERSKE